MERVLICQAEGKEIKNQDTIRGIEHEPGRYITFTPRELERSGVDEAAKTIDVRQFCELEDIDAAYFERPYYIVPNKGGERAYALLRDALSRNRKLAVARFVIYNKERIAVIGLRGDILVLNQLRFAAELVPRSDIKTPPLPKPSPREIDALTAVIDRYSGRLHIEDYHDEQSERIEQLLERKVKGLPPPRESRLEPETTEESELLPVLRQTLEGLPAGKQTPTKRIKRTRE